jgi:quercetin dioxygenase-like cupin family protein
MSTIDTLPEPQPTSLGFRGRFLPTEDPAILVGETWTSPGGGAGPLHRHLHQSERFDVLEGAITVRMGRRRHVVAAGESITIPAGVRHTFVNHTDADAHFIATFTNPGRLESFFTELLDREGDPSLCELADLMGRYPEEFFYAPYAPVRVRRALAAVVRRCPRHGLRRGSGEPHPGAPRG